jgi:hypothetical protein
MGAIVKSIKAGAVDLINWDSIFTDSFLLSSIISKSPLGVTGRL